jgi:eukaryotic-like serine/threonine-protein kinase
VTFAARNDLGEQLLWVQALDSVTARPLQGTQESGYPFWSPDSRFIAFFSGGKLKKLEAAGRPVQTICDAKDGRGGSWNKTG